MVVAKYTRQSSIINIEDVKDNGITIVGCGAIGSFIAISLAKMGMANFVLWDNDTIEAHNLPNQFYKEEDIGKYKTYALAKNMKEFNSDADISSFGKFDSQIPRTPIVISCVDKMDVRKKIFEGCKRNKMVQLYIDTRMGGLQGQVYTVDMGKKNEIDAYEKTLFGNNEAVRLRCTERSIIFTVLGISAIVCNQIKKAFNNEEMRNFIGIDYVYEQII